MIWKRYDRQSAFCNGNRIDQPTCDWFCLTIERRVRIARLSYPPTLVLLQYLFPDTYNSGANGYLTFVAWWEIILYNDKIWRRMPRSESLNFELIHGYGQIWDDNEHCFRNEIPFRMAAYKWWQFSTNSLCPMTNSTLMLPILTHRKQWFLGSFWLDALFNLCTDSCSLRWCTPLSKTVIKELFKLWKV